MKTIKLFGGDLGSETILIRCDLTQASAPIEVDYCTGDGFEGTQYQGADTIHTTAGLLRIGKILAAQAVEMSDFDCDCYVG